MTKCDTIFGITRVLVLVLFTGQVVLEESPRQVEAQRSVGYRAPVAVLEPEGGDVSGWGTWGPHHQCPEATYAYAFRLRVENNRAMFDSTAMNGVMLLCRAGRRGEPTVATINSTVGPWGDWKALRKCLPNEFLIGMQMRIEKITKSLLDNTAANDMDMLCENGGVLKGGGEKWGTWEGWRKCPKGSAICGITTNVQEPQGALVDDVALLTLRLDCCSL